MTKEEVKAGDWIRLTGEAWKKEYPDAPEYVQVVTDDNSYAGIQASNGVGDVGDEDGLYGPGHPEDVGKYACEKVDPSEVPDEIRFKGHPSTYTASLDTLGAEVAASFAAVEAIKGTLADAVNPDHYTFPSGAQVIDITRHLDFLTGNAIKYLARAGRKGDRLEDLKKAERYVRWAIENEENA